MKKSLFVLAILLTLSLEFSTGYTQNNTSGERYIGYHTVDETYAFIDSVAKEYPDIVYLDTLGWSQKRGWPIIGLRISDNPTIDEDEPCILFDGLHHAREPISMEACIDIIDHLVSNYHTDDQITEWIDNTEIWVIPMINPDGWFYCYDKKLDYPYWRKNQRDNNEDGRFLPTIDGVDINRNYDHNWEIGGSGDYASITYRGATAFSESEARAKRDLALREKPLISLSYHTYGEIVIYSWQETPYPPDQKVIQEIANEIAHRIPSHTGEGTYEPRVSNCQNGFSRCWMYTVAGSIEYTVECAKEFIPYGDKAQQVAKDNLNGAMYVLERVHGAGLQIYVKDAVSNEAIVARISVDQLNEELVSPRTSDSIFGRHDRILNPGSYNFVVEADGYHPQTVEDIIVFENSRTPVNVFLEPESSSDRGLSFARNGANLLVNKIYPNPFSSSFTIDYTLYNDSDVRITLLDITGRQIEVISEGMNTQGNHSIKYETRNSDQNLSSGFYILNFETLNCRITQKIWMIQ